MTTARFHRTLPTVGAPAAAVATAVVTALVVALGLLSTVPTGSAAAGATSPEDPRLTAYTGGLAVRPSSNVNTKLAPLPVEFRRAARTWLDRRTTEECPNTPLIKVRLYHRAGFVAASQGGYAATGESPDCKFGRYWGIWSNHGGRWHEVIRTVHDTSCRQLTYHRIPRSMEQGCVNDDGEWVDY